MNYDRISKLHFYLNEEFKKPNIDWKRVAEIEFYLSQEYALTPPDEPEVPKKSVWDWFKLPPNWRVQATAVIGALIAVNSQLHLVAQNVQDALLAGAIALGFYAVNHAQNVQFDKLKGNINTLGMRMGVAPPIDEERKS